MLMMTSLGACSSASLSASHEAWLPNGRQFGTLVVTNAPVWSAVIDHADVPGALVIGILPNSPAAIARVEPGDVIQAVNSQTVADADATTLALQSATATKVTVSLVDRRGLRRDVDADLSSDLLPASLSEARGLVAKPGDPLSAYILSVSSADARSALELSQTLMKDAPNFALGYMETARRLVQLAGPGAAQPARDMTTKALSIAPDSVDVLVAAADVAMKLKDPTSARAYAEGALAADPGSAKAHNLRGSATLALADAADALADFDAATRLDPFTPGYWNNLAAAAQSAGRPDQAASARERAQALTRKVVPFRPTWQPVAATAAACIAAPAVAGLLLSRRRSRTKSGAGARGVQPDLPDVSARLECLIAVLAVSALAPLFGFSFSATRSATAVQLATYSLPSLVALLVAARDLRRASPAPTPAVAAALLAGGLAVAPDLALLWSGSHRAHASGVTLLHFALGLAILATAAFVHASPAGVTPARRPALP